MDRLQAKTPELCPGVHGKPHPDEALDLERSCWRWRLGPNVPGVGSFGLLGHLWRCKRSVDQSGAPVEVSPLARLNDLPTVG
jgi:hypothetical protein